MRQSIEAVLHTLLEAVALVVLVVILFLQTWRASLIPADRGAGVDRSAPSRCCSAFGFSINTLSLFGLVLAIGIVVDDAIVVVENVERHIAEGLAPREATKVAMREVSRPIIAITLVLCAVFVPVAFVSGLTGEFYRQFALTIAISTVISAFNSLTLSPALAARAAQAPRRAARPARRGSWTRSSAGSSGASTAASRAAANGYSRALTLTMRRGGMALVVYAGLHRPHLLRLQRRAGRLHPRAGQAVPGRGRAAAAGRLARAHRGGDAAHRRDRPQDSRASRTRCEFAGMSVNGFTQSSSAGTHLLRAR